MLNSSIHYVNQTLVCDTVPVRDIVERVGTPVYIYSLRRALANYHALRDAFAALQPHIHYSVKANGNLVVLRALIHAGAGLDTVSGGEIYRALAAGARPENIVFAGVGKTADELRYAVQQRVGWINVENVDECDLLQTIAAAEGISRIRIGIRLNPDVQAHTHRHIATGHGGAKFGLSERDAKALLARQSDYTNLSFEAIHVHIGSQLHDTTATRQSVEAALDLIAPYPAIRTIDIGGGLPVAYRSGESLPSVETFAAALYPLLKDYSVILEPGRAIIADAGLLITRVLYVKRHGDECFVIVDAGMTDLIRPALYEAHHEIVPVEAGSGEEMPYHVVGPVCETTDVLGRSVPLPPIQPGDLLAVLTTGAYGMVMASTYNARPRPAEVVVEPDGATWKLARRRETWSDLIGPEIDADQNSHEGMAKPTNPSITP